MMSPVAIRAVIVVIVRPVTVLMTAMMEVTLLSPVVTVLLPSASSCCLVLPPLLVTCRSFSLSFSLSLPALGPEVLEVVLALLLVSPGRVEGGDGGVGLQPRLLDHPATHEVASPVEAVGAVHSYQAGLRTLGHSREEFLHNLFVGHHVTRHKYFPVNQTELLTLPWVIIFVCVCEVNDQFQVWNLSFELHEVPVFILAERNFECNEPGSFHYSTNVRIIKPTIRNFRHFHNFSVLLIHNHFLLLHLKQDM